MTTYTYYPKGTCSKQMEVDLEDGVIKDVRVLGGCNGNLQGISSLVRGMKATDAIERMRGIRCGFKPTSCPDQLSIALEKALEEEKNAKRIPQARKSLRGWKRKKHKRNGFAARSRSFLSFCRSRAAHSAAWMRWYISCILRSMSAISSAQANICSLMPVGRAALSFL